MGEPSHARLSRCDLCLHQVRTENGPRRHPPRIPTCRLTCTDGVFGTHNAERWVGTVRKECTDRILLTGERHLATVLGQYTAHYNQHRPHRSLDQRPPAPRSPLTDVTAATVQRRPILGRLINEYVQTA